MTSSLKSRLSDPALTASLHLHLFPRGHFVVRGSPAPKIGLDATLTGTSSGCPRQAEGYLANPLTKPGLHPLPPPLQR